MSFVRAYAKKKSNKNTNDETLEPSSNESTNHESVAEPG